MPTPKPRSSFFTPLRYPGGKGKIAAFIKEVFEQNDLLDGVYAEPYAGGAGVALELLFHEYARKIVINDVSPHLAAFWRCVLNRTEELCRLIADNEVNIKAWRRQKAIHDHPDGHDELELAYATFFLNRTNRSGILTAGVIGGKNQDGY